MSSITIDAIRTDSSITIDVVRADSSVVDAQLLLGLKGDKGNQGDTGASAGFGTVTASVDGNVGTPSVTVTTSGTDTAKNFDFAFHNLKGADGVCDVNDVKVLNKLYGTDTESYTSQLSSGDAFLSNADFGTLGYVEATSSGSGAFTVSDTTSLRLSDGGIILVKFGADSSNGSTLNIHSADVAYTGNIPIYVNGSAISSGDIKAGDVVALSYDSGNNRWHVIGKSYPRFTASRDGIVPAAGNVSETGEWRLLSNEGWLTVGVVAEYDSPKIPWARKYSAELTGVPTAPTASASTDTTQIATTAFVHDVVGSMVSGVSDVEVDGSSVVSNGVAQIPYANEDGYGVVKIEEDSGLAVTWTDADSNELTYHLPYLDQNFKISSLDLPIATTSASGAMSASDKSKLDGIEVPTKVSDLENDVPFADINQLYSILPTDSASGDIASFTDGADDVPMISVKAQIEPIQSGSGTPSPDNVRPISGHTQSVVEQRGKNLLNPKFYDGVNYSSTAGTSAVVRSGIVDITDRVTQQGNTYSRTGASWQLPMNMVVDVGAFVGESVRVSGTFTGNLNVSNGLRSGLYLTDENYVVKRVSGAFNFNPPYIRTIEEGEKYLIWYINSASAGTITLDSPMIELGSTATDFEPYHGHTYTTQFGQTVYGGSVDLVSGVLTVDRAYGEYDGSADEEWVMHGSGSASAYAMRIGISNFKFIPSVVTAWTNYLPSIDNGKTWGNYDAFISMGATGIITGIRTITTVEDWRAYLAEHPLQVVYELATPTTIQLTPQEIDSFKATNNLWASTGEIEVEYRADIGLYIEKKLS